MKKPAHHQNKYLIDCARATFSFILLIFTLLFPATAFLSNTTSASISDTLLKPKGVYFEENKNQFYDTENNAVPFVLFKAESRNVDLYITETGLTYVFRERVSEENTKDLNWERIDLSLIGAHIKRENIIREIPTQTGAANFFYGHCPNGVYDVRKYEKITIKEVYPNIDWVLYNSEENGFKYDFIARNGADLKHIELEYNSKEKLILDQNGALVIATQASKLQENAPTSFFNDSLINSQFEIVSIQPNDLGGFDSRVQFIFDPSLQALLSDINRTDELRIDPQLLWSTFFGSEHNDGSHTMETDSQNNLFMGGYTYSMGFPAIDAGSYFQGSLTGSVSCFLTKFDVEGNQIWTTYYGGSNIDRIFSLAIDSEDNVYACGKTGSNDFPVMDAGTYFQPDDGVDANTDAFILKFDNDGNRLWATYYAGTGDDQFFSIAADSEDNIYTVGTSESYDFPLMDGGTFYQATFGGDRESVILKFDSDGNRLWSTYYGGLYTDNAFSIAVDHTDNIFVVGGTKSTNFPLQDAGTFFQDDLLGYDFAAFILKFDSEGNRLWATLYGGSDDDLAYCSKIDRHNKLYVTGTTNSDDFPTHDAGTYYDPTSGGGLDAFFLKFDNDGNRLWATYYGGSANEQLNSHDNIAMDACGYVYLAFDTPSLDIETQAFCDDAYFQEFLIGSLRDQFLCKFDSTGVLMGATYYGGNGTDFRSPLAADQLGNVYLSGEWTPLGTGSYPLVEPETGFYNSAHGGAEDIFIAKFSSAIVFAEFSIESDLCFYACEGAATVNLIDNGTCPVNYFWSNGDFTLDSTDPTNTITDLCPGWYSLVVTNECDTLLVDSVEVVSRDAIPYDLDLGNDTLFCNSFSHILDAGDDGIGFVWQDGSTDQTFEVTAAGTYWVTVTAIDGCTTSDTITITVAPDIPFDVVSNEPTCNGYSDGSITLFALGGEGEITYIISNGSGDVLNEEGSNEANALTSGWYYLYVEDELGCANLDSIYISEPGQLGADLVIIPPTCYGLSDGSAFVNSVLNATGDIDSVSFIWNPNPAGVEGIGADSTWLLGHGSYSLTLTDENGCTGIIDFDVIEPDSMVFSEFGFEHAYCRLHEFQSGNGVVYAAAAGGTPDYTYVWTNLDTEETSENTTWGGLNPGNYHIIATDINGCFIEREVYVDSLNPIAKFTINSAQLDENCEGTAPVSAIFTNQSENFANPNNPFADTTFFWNFDYDNIEWLISHDLSESFDTTYQARGFTYDANICLVAINKNGCTDTACKIITIYEPIELEPVNIFSPNGDGINDEFTLEFKSGSIAEFSCVIIDRWGITMHEMNEITDGWNGTNQAGLKCSNGVYFYRYEATTDNGTVLLGQGTIQLIE